MTATRTVTEDIELVAERLDAMKSTLAMMPRSKINTPWHLSRLAEKQRLVNQLGRLQREALGQQCGLYACVEALALRGVV
jgi:hypothetical protein